MVAAILQCVAVLILGVWLLIVLHRECKLLEVADALRVERDTLRTERYNALCSLDKLQVKHSDAMNEIAAQVDEHGRQVMRTISDFAKLRDERDKLRAELAASDDRADDMQAERDEFRQMQLAEQGRAHVLMLQRDAISERCDNLRAHCDRLRVDNDDLGAALRSLGESRDALRKELDAMKRKAAAPKRSRSKRAK